MTDSDEPAQEQGTTDQPADIGRLWFLAPDVPSFGTSQVGRSFTFRRVRAGLSVVIDRGGRSLAARRRNPPTGRW